MDSTGVEPLPSMAEIKSFVGDLLGGWPELARQLSGLESVSAEQSSVVAQWLRWCRSRPGVLTVQSQVPAQVIPGGATLVDVKVGGRKREPDDRIYNKSADIRRKVARGNCVLQLPDGVNLCMVHALRKFTGGMGDEDDGDDGADDASTLWRRYFLRDPETADRLVLTQKANGEAAHLSARWLSGRPLICVGSKNVHMLLRRQSDIELYDASRYQVAREIAKAVWRRLSTLGDEQRRTLLALLHHTRATCVLELLQPEHQHVEDLSFLTEPELRFIAWTPTYVPSNTTSPAGEESVSSLSLCPPELGFRMAEILGLTPVGYCVETGDILTKLPQLMQDVRSGHGFEGRVICFVSEDGSIIGMLKKKTAWYILLRALREKLAFGLDRWTFAELKTRILTRFLQIQSWLGFDDSFLQSWCEVGLGFAQWCKGKRIEGKTLRVSMPPMWNEFLRSTNQTDKFDVQIQK